MKAERSLSIKCSPNREVRSLFKVEEVSDANIMRTTTKNNATATISGDINMLDANLRIGFM